MSEHIDIVRLRRAVRPLADPPQPPGWNATEFPELWSDNTPLRQAAVLLPVICRGDALSMLFTRRNETMRHHAGQISFPGGAMEAADRDPIAAALRETDEETGINASFVEAFGYLDCFDTISGFSVTPVVGIVRDGFKLNPHPDEVAEIFEVPLEIILTPGGLRRSEILWHGRGREIFEFSYDGKRIWGATAAILQNLLRRLEAYR